jgi:hypothetical protein
MNSGDEYLNNVTLKYLTNVDYQNGFNESMQIDNHKNKTNNTNNKPKNNGFKMYKQKDKKFYKKRISNIVKILLNDIEDTDVDKNSYQLFPDIKKSFDVFIKTSIDYFKSMDKCDIIQSDYNNLDIGNGSTSKLENKNCDITNHNHDDNNNEINSLMMRKIIQKKNSMDSFVKRVPTHKITTIIPQKKKINLHNPELKTKGIDKPETDKNISENKNNNIYKKETISKLDNLLNHDNPEEKIPNEKNSKQKKSKKDKKPKNAQDIQNLQEISFE